MDLIGDIGGTKSLFHVYIKGEVLIKSYLNQDFNSFQDLLSDLITYLKLSDYLIGSRVCFAVAAPIINDRASLSNINWTIDKETIKRIIQTDNILLLNDMEAVAYYVARSPILKYFPVKSGSFKRSTNTFLVVGIGTGFGLTIIRDKDSEQDEFVRMDPLIPIDNSRDYSIHPSESGHVKFSPTAGFELDLFNFLNEKMGTVSIEDVCSSRGIYNIYQFMARDEFGIEDRDHRKQILKEKDPTRLIIKHSKGRKPCSLCKYVLINMMSILARKLQDLSLEFLPYQGIFLFGGVAKNSMSYIINDDFINTFKKIDINTDNELKTVDNNHITNMKIILDKVPIYVLTAENAGIDGAKLFMESRIWNNV